MQKHSHKIMYIFAWPFFIFPQVKNNPFRPGEEYAFVLENSAVANSLSGENIHMESSSLSRNNHWGVYQEGISGTSWVSVWIESLGCLSGEKFWRVSVWRESVEHLSRENLFSVCLGRISGLCPVWQESLGHLAVRNVWSTCLSANNSRDHTVGSIAGHLHDVL
jgi:hypothetical protein